MAVKSILEGPAKDESDEMEVDVNDDEVEEFETEMEQVAIEAGEIDAVTVVKVDEAGEDIGAVDDTIVAETVELEAVKSSGTKLFEGPHLSQCMAFEFKGHIPLDLKALMMFKGVMLSK